MSFITDIQISPKDFTGDAWGRIRTSELTTLFDGKILNQEDTDIWDTKWTGTATYDTSKVDLSVGVGQYIVRQGKKYCPYFAWKSQLIETTFDQFANQAGVIKREWYFSSSAVAPYTANFDWIFLESDWDAWTIKLRVMNDWTDILAPWTNWLDWTQWDNYPLISSYNWDNFTVVWFDFLWLGWAIARIFLKTERGFVLAHTFDYSGTAQDTFMKSPNHPVRSEIRSTTWTGSHRTVCSQVATEWSFDEAGKWLVVRNDSAITTNSIWTTYALVWVKKTATNRDIYSIIEKFWVANNTNNDAGIIEVHVNPTLSAPLSYSASSRIEFALATNQTVTAPWRVIWATNAWNWGNSSDLNKNYLNSLDIDIDDVADELVLTYTPTTSNQAVYWILNLKEF